VHRFRTYAIEVSGERGIFRCDESLPAFQEWTRAV